MFEGHNLLLTEGLFLLVAEAAYPMRRRWGIDSANLLRSENIQVLGRSVSDVSPPLGDVARKDQGDLSHRDVNLRSHMRSSFPRPLVASIDLRRVLSVAHDGERSSIHCCFTDGAFVVGDGSMAVQIPAEDRIGLIVPAIDDSLRRIESIVDADVGLSEAREMPCEARTVENEV